MAGLAGMMVMGLGDSEGMSKAQAMEKLKEAERLMSDLNLSWEDKLMKTQLIMKERLVAMWHSAQQKCTLAVIPPACHCVTCWSVIVVHPNPPYDFYLYG